MEYLLLSTLHLDQTTDTVQLDSNSKQRLTEQRLEPLIELLAQYKPEQIFVEFPVDYQIKLNEQYEQYVQEDKPLGTNEVYQIGFKLAKKLQLHAINTVDWNEDIEGLKNLDDITDKSSLDRLQQILLPAHQQMQEITKRMVEEDIISLYRYINSLQRASEDHQMYVQMLQMNNEIAFDWVMHYWYARNMRIVKNIMAASKKGLQRGLIIYGSGHQYLLTQFFREIDGVNLLNFEDLQAVKNLPQRVR